MTNSQSPLDERTVSERAYQLWEQAGRPGGRDSEFWYQAENQLKAERNSGPPPLARPARSTPPRLPTAPVHEVPPPIRGAVKTYARRAPRPGSGKRTARG